MADVSFRRDGDVGKVTVDGHDLSNIVRAAIIDLQAGQVPAVLLTLNVSGVTAVDLGGALVSVDEATADALKVLGWKRRDE